MFALLIGINLYLPNRLSNGLYYKSLWGCAQDAQLMASVLREKFDVSEDHIIMLTSTANGTEPLETPDKWPTYANIVSGFRKLEEMAQPGDQVYIHYSGHGGRAKTTSEFQHLKRLDEVLVPMDLGNSEGKYLRDTELQYLIQRLIDKRLYVTVVLDSCHAGSSTRGSLLDEDASQVSVRGINGIDYEPRPLESLVAPAAELVDSWKRRQKPTVRSVQVGSGWLLEPEGYVLLAACRASEYANEFKFEAEGKNGALSYWWCDSLKGMSPGFTYKMLHDRVLAKVYSQFPDQTPQLQGEGNRVVFGSEERIVRPAVTVLGLNPEGKVQLNAGQAQGIDIGAEFNVYGLHETDLSENSQRIALVKVVESTAGNSVAIIIEGDNSGKIEAGCQALLFPSGDDQIGRQVRLDLPTATAETSDATNAFNQVEKELGKVSNGFIKFAANNESSDFVVTIVDNSFVVFDRDRSVIPHFKPLKISDERTPKLLVERLIHITKYQNVKELRNTLATELSSKLRFELIGVQSDYRAGEEPRPQPFPSGTDVPTAKTGETAFLQVTNNAAEVVNITVFDLMPNWAVKQIYPARSGAFEPLDPGQQLTLPLNLHLPEGFEVGIDVIKVFATIESTSFRWFELPPLDTEDNKALSVPRSGSLETYFSKYVNVKVNTRDVSVVAVPVSKWAAKQVKIKINA